MSTYANNLEKVNTLITRNQDNAQALNQASFWISDVKHADGSNKMEVVFQSKPNWLKIVQTQANVCSLFPVDGNDGMFLKQGLPVSDKNLFIYESKTKNGIEREVAGDCDCLIISNKWHFIEFKTEASSQEIHQINNNRNKGEAQLAKSMTSFKEQLAPENVKCVCVLVVPTFFSFPKFRANFSRKPRFLKLFKVELMEITTDGNDSYPII
jgi:hypothetical protein